MSNTPRTDAHEAETWGVLESWKDCNAEWREFAKGLERELRALRAKPDGVPQNHGWIACGDKLPEPGAEVLAYWPGVLGGESCMDVVVYSDGMWHNPDDDEDDYCAPSHWQPLVPEPPNDAALTAKE